jgi:DMSO/TMAO reductase YedYZ molybdopterin-dependent catalytic subunit
VIGKLVRGLNHDFQRDQRAEKTRAAAAQRRPVAAGAIAHAEVAGAARGDVPRVNLRTWDFRIDGLVEKPVRLTWEEFNHLPQTEIQCDMHCVTRWSRFDNRFEGVLFTEVMKLVTPKSQARFAMLRGENGYTTNLPLEDLMKHTTIFAFKHDGEPLSAEHGYPLRLIVPHLYLWKSVKWVRGFELSAEDAPGFWEQNGYHMYGDPWKEQRFDTD